MLYRITLDSIREEVLHDYCAAERDFVISRHLAQGSLSGEDIIL